MGVSRVGCRSPLSRRLPIWQPRHSASHRVFQAEIAAYSQGCLPEDAGNSLQVGRTGPEPAIT